MNRRPISLALAGVLASSLLAGSALADTPAEHMEKQRVDQRQDRQAERIAAGAESGQLTRREQARLQRQQARTARLEQRAEADGQLSRQEALRLEKRQDHGSRMIRRQKHDAQARP